MEECVNNLSKRIEIHRLMKHLLHPHLIALLYVLLVDKRSHCDNSQ